MAGVSTATLYRWLDKGIPKNKEHIITRLLPNQPDTETTATPPAPTTIAVPNNDAVLLLQVFITTKAV